MKPWVWLLMSFLAVAGSIYLWKKQPPPVASAPAQVEAPQMNSPEASSRPPNQNIPTPRGSVPPYPTEPQVQTPTNDENNPGFPSVPPPPPPPPSPFPIPESEPLDYYEGDPSSQPFEPPPPLDESGGFIPPPPPINPEGGE